MCTYIDEETGLTNLTAKEDNEDNSEDSKAINIYNTWPDRSKGSPHEKVEISKQSSSQSLESLSYTNRKPCDNDTLADNKPGNKVLDDKQEKTLFLGMTNMATALDNLSLTYSPGTRKLHVVEESYQKDGKSNQVSDILEQEDDQVSLDNNQEKTPELEQQATRYIPGHRKAFSLPRTLEVVDENGSILELQPVENLVESPRTTLQRYGLPYKPYNFDGESIDGSEGSGISGLTDYSERNFPSENSSHGDSGIFSETSGSISKQSKRGITELLSKGLGTGWKSLSKSGQQMVKLIKKEAPADGIGEPQPTTSLIMEPRPPGLPAKGRDEEERHRSEHRFLMDQVKRKENKDSKERARKLAEQRRSEEDMSSLASYWATQVLPHWGEGTAQTRKSQSHWWRGLPPPVRGRVWFKALDNTLNLTPQLYNILVTRAKQQLLAASEESEEVSSMSTESREETLELIKLDVSRTFPQLGIFQTGGPYYDLLHNVLGAFVCYRPDIGYVQGMSFLAAVLILNLDEAEAFIIFANLINRPVLSAFYTVNQQEMSQNYSTFSNLFSAHLPQLASHFQKLGLRPDLYILDWVMTLFSKAAPLDVACRIWDLLVRDGEMFLFRAAVGILALYEGHLMAEFDFVVLAQFLAKLPDTMDGDLLFEKIAEVSVGTRNLQQIISQIVHK